MTDVLVILINTSYCTVWWGRSSWCGFCGKNSQESTRNLWHSCPERDDQQLHGSRSFVEGESKITSSSTLFKQLRPWTDESVNRHGFELYSNLRIVSRRAQEKKWEFPFVFLWVQEPARLWEKMLLSLEVAGGEPGVEGEEVVPLAKENIATPWVKPG